MIPEMTTSLGFGWVMNMLPDNNRIGAVVVGNVLMAIAALLVECPRKTHSRVPLSAQGLCAVVDVRVTPRIAAGSLICGHTSIITIPEPRNSQSGTRAEGWT